MICWHYTIGRYVPLIAESGVLELAAGGVHPPEKPILWFSSNPFWEVTASKWNGKGRVYTMEEMAQAVGVVRFGISCERLIRWPEVGKRANMNFEIRKRLMKWGRSQGANPSEWYGSLTPIPLQELIFQILRDNQWIDPEGE